MVALGEDDPAVNMSELEVIEAAIEEGPIVVLILPLWLEEIEKGLALATLEVESELI